MKKILVIIFAFLLIGCSSDTLEKNDNKPIDETIVDNESFQLANSFEKGVSDIITLKVDPKIESTYLIAHMLSDKTGYDVYFDEDEYVLNQVEEFSVYKDHEVFTILENMISKGFTYDAISGALHYYDDNLELIDGLKPDENILRRAGGQEQVEKYLKALYDFRKVSQYDKYFLENEQYFTKILNRAAKHIESSNMSEVYLNYYGESLGPLVVVVTPVTPMGYGNRIELEEKKILMPTLRVSLDEEQYISFLLHEISHSYVNPQTTLKFEKVNTLEKLYEPIESSMRKQSYPTWEISLNEHIVRANVIMMIEEIYGTSARENRISYEMERDFIYLSNVLESLNEYTQTREGYPVFHMYYDLILKNLKSQL
ncbi:MAG TPA: DUF4932 domain-containing protein [Clostridia bacterium]|nr:DUF4932 domain-containing protein [Clostridia bacterium]